MKIAHHSVGQLLRSSNTRPDASLPELVVSFEEGQLQACFSSAGVSVSAELGESGQEAKASGSEPRAGGSRAGRLP